MMALLLDTVVVSELRKVRHPATAPAFTLWAESVELITAYLSVLTIHEMRRCALLTEHKDPRQTTIYHKWMDDVLDAFRDRILPLSLEAAQVAAGFHVPDPAPLADSLIAGTAHVNHLTVATRNVADFSRFDVFDVPILNPWADSTSSSD